MSIAKTAATPTYDPVTALSNSLGKARAILDLLTTIAEGSSNALDNLHAATLIESLYSVKGHVEDAQAAAAAWLDAECTERAAA